MNAFAQGFASQANKTETTNGCGAYKSTRSALVDFFYQAGSMSFDASEEQREGLYNLFEEAFDETEMAIPALFWLRDVRGGAGQREMFRYIVRKAIQNDSIRPYIQKVFHLIPEYGRWDDLWKCGSLENKDFHNALYTLLLAGLAEPSTQKLLAKWLPRERKPEAATLMKIFNFSPVKYRKICSELSKGTVEVLQSSKKWDEIAFETVPSLAMMRYTKAFERNCGERFTEYKEALKKGTAKINAGAVYPFQIVANRYSEIADAQWKALPDYVPEGLSFMPMVDVSGSMDCRIGSNTTAMDVAVSLGLYLSERQKGPFKDMFITFSESPQAVVIPSNKKTLVQKVDFMERSDWDMNTDIHKAVNLILSIAQKNKVPAADMPKSLLILSDMQFDVALDQRATWNRSAELVMDKLTFMEAAKQKYEAAGYEFPHIVFWNLAGNRYGNAPAEYNIPGISMVSGFSPSIMQYILQGKEITPLDQVLEILTSNRYKPVIEAIA